MERCMDEAARGAGRRTASIRWARLVPLLLLLGAGPAPPAFQDLPAGPAFTGRVAPPDVTSHPRARTYRTALRQEVKEQPDFAGHYTLVQIGCGAGCVIVAIVEARSGRVFFPGALRQIHSAGWWHE